MDLTPAQLPAAVAIAGERVTAEPVAPRHRDGLFQALHADGDPGLWRFLPYGPFGREEWDGFFARACESDDPRFYALVAGGEPGGMASYLRIVPDHGVIEIGHVAFGPALQRTAAATEAIFVLARHAFDDLGYRRLEWKCDASNERSRRAAERFGFTFEGVFRNHMVVKGRNRDTAWFAIVDSEWPAIRAACERWLEPGNFDRDGRRRRSLADLRAC